MPILTTKAYAKLNLSLEVLGKREDGFHEIRSILQTIDLWDMVSFEISDSIKIACDVPELNNQTNIAYKAVSRLKQLSQSEFGIDINIKKGIPIAGGLGGGSSDAAVTLKALNELWGLELSSERLEDIGASVGSDIPALLREATVLGEGRGELISEIRGLDGTPIILIFPKSTIENKTKQMYGNIRSHHYTDGSVTDRLINNLHNKMIVETDMFNVFETVAFEIFEELQTLKTSVETDTGLSLHLCGAGPGMFAIDREPSRYPEVREICSLFEAEANLVHAIIPSQMYC